MNIFGADKLKAAKKGDIVPVYKITEGLECPVEFFAKLSDYGRKPHCLLLESASPSAKYAEFSMGTASPCLKVSGKGADFTILSLNKTGDRFLEFIKNDFSFCDTFKYAKGKITGTLLPKRQ